MLYVARTVRLRAFGTLAVTAAGLTALVVRGGLALRRAVRLGEPLPPGDHGRAVRGARILTRCLPFQLAQLTLLGLLLSQLAVLAEDFASAVVLTVLIVTYAAFLPLTPRLRRRAHRYAAEHEDVLAAN